LNSSGEIREYSSNDDRHLSDQFSFIQEESQYKVSYAALLEQMNGRMLIERTNVAVSTTKPYNVMNEDDMNAAFIRQICIWLPISLAVVLFFTVFALIDMPVQKNSILYAKYGTTKQLQSQ
jgi:hypothetical protein